MDTSTFGFGIKSDLKPYEYTNLFGDPFWGEAGSLKARNIYLQLNEREKALMLKANYIKMIEKSRARNFNMAADCLQWWLDGSGFTKNINFNWLRKQREVIAAEEENIERFEDRLKNENFDKTLIKVGDFIDYNNKLHYMFTGGIFGELYYTCGTSTIISECNFKITKMKDNFVLSGTIVHSWWDRYDWHKGANAFIYGFGNVGDSEALLVEKYCGAKPFDMRSQWQQSFNRTFQSGFLGGLSIKLK
ncbi:hypothetical protein OA93_01285 [Flavobacterium sp. KMS]|uniref:hypothetical protein n=1 Tax=Flavobacterium sp. KMS TaxID=1566023 RepID=UPI00057EB52B|nr:hypothetical protein [Flavobacterium sp. KMS]KIC00272.1 hypothetical protein OA93_01285 [Flavobacterium sp. KMS]